MLRLDSEPPQSESPHTTYLRPRFARPATHRFRCKLVVESVQDDVTIRAHRGPIDRCLERVQRLQSIPCAAARCFRSWSSRLRRCKQLGQFLDVLEYRYSS